MLLDGVTRRLVRLSTDLWIHVLTADTHGTLGAMAVELRTACVAGDQPTPTWEPVATGTDTEHYERQLEVARVVALGNGANDEAMLRAVGHGIAVIAA